MLHPSYSDLMKVVNDNADSGEHPVVNSRYSIVMATSRRARQIIAGDEPMVDKRGKKPLSIAIEELKEQQVCIVNEEEEPDEILEKAERAGHQEEITAQTGAAEAAKAEGAVLKEQEPV